MSLLDKKEIAAAAAAIHESHRSQKIGQWASTSSQKNSAWEKKHQHAQKHAHQHNKDPAWFKHEKHVLICSWAARPIFSRYGDTDKLAGYFGVLVALISNFQKSGDTVRTIKAGKHLFVFLLKGPLYFIAISRTGESALQLTKQLEYAHDQIVSLLTGSIKSMLEKQPGFDIRTLMGGTEHLLADLIALADRNYSLLLDAQHCLRMRRSTRSKIKDVLKKGRTKDVMFAILLSGTRLIHLVQQKDLALDSKDLLILMNFVTNSQSLRSSESWTPICLPNFSFQGYVYAYVQYLLEDVCLILITGSPDGFHTMKDCKEKIFEGLQKKGCFEGIEQSLQNADLDIDELDCQVPELRHFLYKSLTTSQILFPAAAPPYSSRKAQKTLFRRYQHAHACLHEGAQKPHQLYFSSASDACLLAWRKAGEFEVFATFTPLVTKESAITACNRTLRWIKKEENTLFIRSS
eukprot:gb/GEZN01007631.1/.p1 GENE.gb/GEZN01007631.1/~~gb/GEZN01007631.1/.p1  ORF type:complete len:462 (+),score=55.52 gb/GEZN01007631.1/:121-1506(+)